jgi:hypothetical protein
MLRVSLFLLLFPMAIFGQKLPSIDEKINGLQKKEGFLNFYWNENTGTILMEVDKPGMEILYLSSLPAGLGSNDIGLDRGLLGSEKIVKFERSGRKLLMVQPNYAYRATSNDVAEKRAVEQSFAQSVIWGFSIEAETNGRYLVDVTDFLTRDAIGIAARIRSTQQGNYSLDKTRSAVYLPGTKNFPLNTEFEATVTFVNSDGSSGNLIREVAPSAESISMRIHHSFIQLPDAAYVPRIFDPRSSFIPISYYDYSSPVSTPIAKYFITRHRLQKKDPTAAVSEAVKPIIYYIDNGTPEPIRSALLEGASWWNQAFETAGFKNAFQVKILPEDADPMDVRYNVINWVHRSTRGWSYGASVTDPRTGEIIKGHVTLGSLRVRQDYLIATGLLAPFETGVPADDKMLKMALDRLKQLSAHEIGHTIGLMHNYAASVSDRASVMDYPHPFVKLDRQGNIDLAEAYDLKIGEWDKVAINFGYRQFGPGENEREGLNKIMEDANRRGLQYIADTDARAAGGLHPQAHLWDNGNNAVEALKDVMTIRNHALGRFGERNVLPGTPMAMLEDVLVPVYFYHRYQAEAVTKLVGGMHYTYATRGDGQVITKSMTREEQLGALNVLIDCIDPSFLELPSSIAGLIPPRPAGYNFSRELFKKRTGLAFDVLSPAETGTDFILSFLFNPDRLNRMIQYQTAGKGLGLKEMINTLVSKTWKAKRKTGMQELIQQQTEQILLTYLLSASVNEKNSYAVRSVIQLTISRLAEFINAQSKIAGNEQYKGHLLLAIERVKEPTEAKPTVHKEMPPGAPIGCFE